MSAGDAVMAVALADSLFLSISPDAARERVLLFLAVSFIPFAVVAPLIGPFIDRMRGGRRMVIRLVAVLRVVIAVLMMSQIDEYLLFPLAFAALVLQKTYAVSKSALVPTVVRSEPELVEANSKLGLISGIVGTIIVVPAAVLQKLIGSDATLVFNALVFLAALVAATRLPKEVVAARPARQRERHELHAPSIVLAASAMGFLRAAVGFLFFHLAFWLRTQDAGTFWFGLAVTLSALATMLGNAVAPRLRAHVRVELMLIGSLLMVVLAGAITALVGGVAAGVALAAVVNLAGSIGRLAFDSIVQRDAPDANRGRAFAQFEVRFQLGWVIAGLVPVVVTLPGAVGYLVVAVVAAAALVVYVRGNRAISEGRPLPPTMGDRARECLRRRTRAERATTPAPRPRPPSGGRPPA
jgi:MFS family permease